MEIHPYYFSWQKRVFDVMAASGLLILLTPVFIMIGTLIFLTAGWPIFYVQNRCGQNKKIFKILKFRTMYVGAEKNQWRYQKNNSAPKPMYKNWHDPRFVGIGRWLSRNGLDELPQLTNIIKNEMSFVGPRPLPIYETKKLSKNWNFRYRVKPGIFSKWSVAINQINSLNDWIQLEKNTLKQGGLKYEIDMIVKTIKTLF